ncbi:MAG: TonB-dependent receptor [Ignavibacterium album]|uniref:TonB-dependent receptor n=1 Tax=Ignavibacterium album TaxID=591197 RepID=UPI0026F26F2B|nr:carboxypeptidase regulatory-like domain-containing protein [Ignavibacterium album]MBI5661363.1 TonB-dependent receptor [Ignavibacterium album]
MRKLQLILSIVFLVTVVGFFQNAFSQVVTTASMYGTVTDDKGEALPGANIIALHVPSGTQYGTSTRADGKFNITGMRVGGPYKVTVSFVGYNSQSIENLYLELGQNLKVDFKLSESAIQLGDITVVAERDAIIRSDRTGTSTTVRKESIETLPTISRRIEDLTRLTPQVGRNSTFAGMDNRFNNITIDGSYFNNSFGLAGLPGDRTGVAPISLDAIEQIQVNISPFDVRNGNFVGAGVNTVTKSGTNEYSASVYYNFRNNTFVGKNAGDVEFKSGTFKFGQYGMRLGAPIVQNKLFLFVNFEDDKLTQPGTTYIARPDTSTPVGGNVTRVLASDLDALSNYLKSNFGYETGPYQGYDFETPSTRFLAKLDYNIDNKNKVSLRYTHLDSFTDVLLSNSSSLGFGTRRSTTQALNFANSNYKIMENIRSIVGEWNSILADNMSNNFIVGYTYNDESRESKGKFFPFVDILQGGSVYTSFGFEPFTPNNELRYKSFQLQNNLSVYLGEHNLTFGISAERYESENVFFPGSQSVYVYNSLADFYTDANDYLVNPNRTTSPVTLRRFQVRWSNIPGQEKPIQPLKVWYTGAYAQDQWQVLDNLNIIAGLRVDVPFFENTGYHNPEVDTMNFRDENGNIVNYRTDKMPDANILFSPRIGFNYDVFGNKMTQLRGGTGIFTGKPAYVWISNQIGNNGILTGFKREDNTTNYPFNPNPNRYKPTNVTGAPAGSYELALTDPNFKFPQLWRSNLGVDQKLPLFGLVATVEGLYSRDVNGIYYINANQAEPNSVLVGADTRPRWTSSSARKIYQNVDNAIVLKNQNEGYYWSISAALEKPFSDNWYFKAGYNYGEAKNTVDPGSIAFGSWNNNQHSGNANNPGLGFSANSPGHRVFGTLSYKFDYFNFGSTTITLFGEAFTQGNASYTYAGDLNGDGGTSNDLIYIPKDASEMYFEQYTDGGTTFTVADQQAAWNAFIEQDEYLSKNRGKYAERGAVFMPMVFRADLSVIQEFYGEFIGKKNSLQVRVDILNFTNLLNKQWGVGDDFVTTQPLIFRSIDTEGKPVYRLRSVGGKLIDKTFQKSASVFDVYRIQLGVRYNFN